MQVDLVTETDKACEDLIFSHLQQLYPTHKVNTDQLLIHFTHHSKFITFCSKCSVSKLVPTVILLSSLVKKLLLPMAMWS